MNHAMPEPYVNHTEARTTNSTIFGFDVMTDQRVESSCNLQTLGACARSSAET